MRVHPSHARRLLPLLVAVMASSGAHATTTFEKRVGAGNDDGEEYSGGSMYLNSTDLELSYDSGSNTNKVGVRFRSVTIPAGQVIINAYIQFTVDETDSGACSLTIRGHDTDDANDFASTNITARTTTTAFASWSPPAWNSTGAAGADQRTPDLSAIVQEIIDRGGWSSGNDMVFIFTGSGTRTAEAYDGTSSQAPLLRIEYGNTVTIADHDTGQQSDAFTFAGGETDAELFRFKLTPSAASSTITQLVLSISQISGLTNGDWANVEIVVDTNGDGAIGAGETTTVGGAGAVSQAGGTITFNSNFAVTAATNYIVRADFSSLSTGDSVSIDLMSGNVSTSDTVAGSAGQVIHIEGSFAADVLLVVVDSASLNTQESAKRTLIEGWGYRVVPISATASQAAFDSAAAANDVVYISETISSSNLGTKLKAATIGVVMDESALPDEFGISSSFATFTDSAVDITDTTHFITRNFSAGPLSIFASAQPLQTTAGTLGGYQTLAERPSSTSDTLVVMETGATLTGGGPGTIDIPVSSSYDDAEEEVNDGDMNRTSGDLDIGDNGSDPQIVGMRFRGISIPQGETITNAYVQFTVDGTDSGTCSFTIRGEDVDDASQFSSSDDDISDRPTTTAFVAWSPPDWSSVGASGADQRTPDLSPIIQEIVNRAGWSSGNDIVVTVSGTGAREADSYNGSSSNAPVLHIEYGTSGVAAGRRVYLPWGGSSLDIDELTADGKTMMKRSLEWAAGPVAHWKLDDDTGTTATDWMGGHDGTLTGGTWTSGTLAGGLEFNGSSDYVTVSDDAALRVTDAITIAAWIKGDTWGSGSDVDIILRKGESNPNNWQMAVADGRVSLILDNSDGSGVTSNLTLSTGQWYHVAATWDGSNVRVYVDGVLDNTPSSHTTALGTDVRSVYLGGRAGADLFDGILDDVRLYNRALSAQEIADLATIPSTASLLFVVVDPSGLTTQELTRKTQFESWAYAVTTIDESDLQANFDTAIASNDVVYVSEEISASNLGTKLLGCAIGVVTEDRDTYDAFGLTASNAGGTTDSQIDVLNYDHYITSPFTTGTLTICTSAQDMNRVSQAVARNGQVLADWPLGDHALIAIDAGGRLIAGGRAEGRRVFLPIGGTTFDFGALNADGLTIVQRSLEWGRGLMAHWKLDETAGTTAVDSLGGYDATLTSMDPSTDWTTGRIDNGLDFDGADDHAVTAATFNPPTEGTVVFWMRPPGSPSSQGRVFGLDDTWEVRHVSVGTSDGTPYGLVFDLGWSGTNNDFVTTTTVDSANRWYHVGATYSSTTGTYEVYLDGALHASGTGTISVPAGAAFSIGRRTGASGYFTGTIDDLRISNLVMGADEIKALCDARVLRIITWQEIEPN